MELDEMLKRTGLSPTERKVYVAMLNGSVKVQQIQNVTNVKRPTVYYCLKQLEQLGLVSKTKTHEVSRYVLEPIEKLSLLIDSQKQYLEDLSENLEQVIAAYSDRKQEGHTQVIHYESIESVKQAIMYSLYAKAKVIRSIVPTSNLFEKLGEDFKKRYVLQKKKQNIQTMAMWGNMPSKQVINKFYSNNIQVKKLPKETNFESTVFIYDNKVLYISGTKQKPSAVLVTSRDQSDMMKYLFDSLFEA